MMKVLITDGHYPAIATHDPAMIDLARRWAAERGVGSDRFEFQMLYGIRRDLQAMLVEAGLSRPRLCAVRPRLVSLLHAPAGRTSGERRLRAPGSLRGGWVTGWQALWRGLHRSTSRSESAVRRLTLLASRFAPLFRQTVIGQDLACAASSRHVS